MVIYRSQRYSISLDAAPKLCNEAKLGVDCGSHRHVLSRRNGYRVLKNLMLLENVGVFRADSLQARLHLHHAETQKPPVGGSCVGVGEVRSPDIRCSLTRNQRAMKSRPILRARAHLLKAHRE